MTQSAKRPPRAKRPGIEQRAKAPSSASTSAPDTFPVVGIGASAGGLEALEQFLAQVPAASGMAFVIVQHLDPTQKGMLVELLARVSPLPVVQVTDGMQALPGHVYVIPPNKDMSIVHRVLHLFAPVAPRGLRLPIDFFFRSLADDARQRGVGVVLSGMGSDGTLGLRAIRDNEGCAFVQTPGTAKCDGMPQSAIAAGLADVVASPGELPGRIEDYFRGGAADTRQGATDPDKRALRSLEKIVGLLRSATGQDFSPYKSSTICRRIERRMGLHQIGEIEQYVTYLRENPGESALLLGDLLIGVTSFFRDSAAWESLKHDVLSPIAANCESRSTIRAWVPACSTGEEAYSLAIAFKEAVLELDPPRSLSIQIFATDLDASAVQKARQGVYSDDVATDVSASRLRRFFVKETTDTVSARRFEISWSSRLKTSSRTPPFTKLDLVLCRNLLIYLSAPAQQKLIPLFHYSLRPGGGAVPRQRRNSRHLHRSLRHDRRQGADLSAPSERRHRWDFARPGSPAVGNGDREHVAVRRGCQRPPRLPPKLTMPCGERSVGAFCPRRRTRQQQGGCPPCERPDRAVSRTASRQSQLEHPRDGSRRLAALSRSRVSTGDPNQ